MKQATGTSKIFFSREIYSAEALRLAAAVFEGRIRTALKKSPGGMTAEISGPAGAAGEFCNEALNQQCRIDLGLKNSRLASIISTKALLAAAGEKPARR